MFDYLQTKDGIIEIKLVAKELDKEERFRRDAKQKKITDNKKTNKNVLNEEDNTINQDEIELERDRKKSIYEVFRKYDVDGSNSIDADELQKLLKELKLELLEEEFKELFKSLDSDGGGEIDFEEFYKWFLSETETRRPKGIWGNVKSVFMSDFHANLLCVILETEARNILFDCVIARAEEDALKEYRIAHAPPPGLLCQHCCRSFARPEDLFTHENENRHESPHENRHQSPHEEYDRTRRDNARRFRHVDTVFLGSRGRGLQSARLLFSPHLGTSTVRIQAAVPAPFRPRLAAARDPDPPEGTRHRDRRVQGSDPSEGVRARYRHFGLGSQHSSQRLQTVLLQLLHARTGAEDIDTVVAPAASAHAEVRFQWGGYAPTSIQLVGDFNAWVPEDMHRCQEPGTGPGKRFLVKFLGPGKYRYRYLIDGTEVLDNTCSIEYSTHTAASTCNIIQVINPPSTLPVPVPGTDPDSGPIPRHLDLRNMGMYDDGVWTLASYLPGTPGIESLDLSFNCISDTGMQALAPALSPASLPGLRTVLLAGNGFGLAACQYLTRAVGTCTSTLTSLDLSKNSLCDDGAACIAAFITHHGTLSALRLDGCYVGEAGAASLARALRRNASLRLLSLACNTVRAGGAGQLARALRCNGTLLELYFQDNTVGADAAKEFADMLYENTSLHTVDLSNTHIVSGRSGAAIKALCSSLRRNTSLRVLHLRNNSLTDDHALDLAHALRENRGLRTLDLAGNAISQQWFAPDTHLATRLHERMPSIKTSLEYNASVLDDPVLGKRYIPKPPVMDPLFDGEWTERRKWKQVNHKAEQRKYESRASKEEEAHMQDEDEYVCKEVLTEMKAYNLALEDESISKDLLTVLAKLIANHYHNITKLAPAPNPDHGTRTGNSAGSTGLFSRRVPHDQDFKQTHLAIMSIVFKDLGANPYSLTLSPVLLEQAFHNICLPMLTRDMQPGVAATLLPSKRRPVIGFQRFCEYVTVHGSRLGGGNAIQRYRLLTDLYFHAPVREARAMLLDAMRYRVQDRTVRTYRAMPGKAPSHVCAYCNLRFESEKKYTLHRSRDGYEHRRYRMHTAVHAAQTYLLRKANYLLTGNYFPGYYELVPETDLPLDYSPRVVDRLGAEGRPRGVVEPNRAVRVEDVMGEYLNIAFEGGLAWVRYRLGTRAILRPCPWTGPAVGTGEGGLRVFYRPVYYMARKGLGAKTALKVRYQPLPTGGVCGYVRVGVLVQCLGTLGDWLQIRYGREDCVWVLRVATGQGTGEVLMEALPQVLQQRLGGVDRGSPYTPRPEELVIPDGEGEDDDDEGDFLDIGGSVSGDEGEGEESWAADSNTNTNTNTKK